MRKLVSTLAVIAAAAAAAPSALATVSVAWTSPQSGDCFPVGTLVTPVGQASASGVVGGTGLDLALVIDTSGSMSGANINTAKTAAQALVSALPTATTSVTIITFDSSANVYRQLTPLVPTSNVTALNNAIGLLTAPGSSTAIGSGITAAAGELTGVRHTAGRSQQMVVLSDGANNAGGDPLVAATSAVAAGVDAIHTVGVPGHSVATMRGIADGPDGVYGNADDYGTYTDANNLSILVGLFSGTTGNLVGIDHVEVTMPDGTTATVPVDGLGNFSAPSAWAIQAGWQSWSATAYATDGSSASAGLRCCGQQTGIPDAGSSIMLLGFGLMGLVGAARSTRK